MKNEQVLDQIDKLFRQHSGQLISTLTRIFGVQYLNEAESLVQEAFYKACQVWPYKGMPENPLAWLTTVAKNKTYDLISKQKKIMFAQEELARFYQDLLGYEEHLTLKNEWVDDLLGMMFLCCHPSLSKKSQVCLTLKCVSGFSVKEIAHAFLSKEEATKRLISRAKKRMQEDNPSFHFPPPSHIHTRIDTILDVIYLIFNEGYNASTGNEPIRQDLCDEAIRLAGFLLHDSFQIVEKAPIIKALLALMLLHSAKNPARLDNNGKIILLQNQDRNLWSKERISLGLQYLSQCAKGFEISSFHLEAHIASCHIMAESYEQANWPQILEYYHLLFKLKPNPVIKMNQIIALGMVSGPETALPELLKLEKNSVLNQYHLLYAVIADFYAKAGQASKSAMYYQTALRMAKTSFEKEALEKKIIDNKLIS